MLIDRGLLGGTVSANQKGAAPLAVFAAPATGDEVHTLGERLVPKGCFKIEDLLFDFDSSFVRPDIVEIAQRYRECNLHPRALEALETARQLPGAP